MPTHSFAWSKLFQATVDLASSDAPLVQRVQTAYSHLATLNSTNMEPHTFARIKELREQFARGVSSCDADDATVTLTPLSPGQASSMATEIVSIYDEVTRAAGATVAE